MTLWTVFVDCSLFAGLMVIGQILRSKIKFFQKTLIPASLIGGLLGLIFGPELLGILPFSSSISGYAGILIALVFAAMPIGDKSSKEDLKSVGGMFINVTGIAVAQYLFGLVVCVYILGHFWELNNGFGLIMATGFYGGHGTAGAVGAAYADLGWAEAQDLMMFSATFGIIMGIVVGMVIINWGTRKGYTSYVKSPDQLPEELRTGLIDPKIQKASGKITISPISLDPLAFHLGLILIPSLAGYLLSEFISSKISLLSIPVFCLSLIFGFIFQKILVTTKTDKYVDRPTIQRISGTCTDFLVVSGVASIKISVVASYMIPLMITFIGGLILNWIWFMTVGRDSSKKDWFERNMMVWGHATGVAATGVLLQRVVDPDLKSRGIEDSGIADIFNRPILIALQVLPPIFLTIGGMYVHLTIGAVALVMILLLVAALIFKWWVPGMNAKSK